MSDLDYIFLFCVGVFLVVAYLMAADRVNSSILKDKKCNL